MTFLIRVRVKGEEVHFGIRATREEKGEASHFPSKRNKSIFREDALFRLTPILISRLDRRYLLERGGGQNEISDKHVALIGCGSVGGAIAMHLAHSGVRRLTLVDPDIFTSENLYRHVLGMNYLDTLKVDALKIELERMVPQMKIISRPKKIEYLIKRSGVFQWNKFDLVIVALGEPTLELRLNQESHKAEKSAPMLFTWLEPLGIGGHVIVTRQPQKTGCLECLYQDKEIEEGVFQKYNAASFAAPNQHFVKNLAGCTGAFTPYSCLDAQQTALLACRQALQVLTGEEKDCPQQSWRGDPKMFLNEGYKLSKRAENLTDQEREDKRYEYKNPSCPVCSVE